jgi:hypothetical protein
MSHTKRILGCMKFGREYRQDEISVMSGLPIDDVDRVCKMLEQGGVLERTSKDGLKKRKERKFKSNQRELFA